MYEQQRQEAELRRLQRVKAAEAADESFIGPEVVEFFKQSVVKRQKKFGKVAEAWEKLIPPPLAQHCAMESFGRGSLTVLVDSAAHLYELKQLLLAGVERQLLLACKSSGLRKINLRQGRWYSGTDSLDRKPKF